MAINTYNLIDTGYANKSASGAQETRANSGTALALNITSVSWDRNTGTSDNPNPGRYVDTEVNKASITNPSLSISGVLKVDDANYATDLAALDDMCLTKGLKLFYYSDSSDGFKPITDVKGAVSHGSLGVGGSVKSLLVECLSFRFSEPNNTDATKGIRRYTLIIEVTNPNN